MSIINEKLIIFLTLTTHCGGESVKLVMEEQMTGKLGSTTDNFSDVSYIGFFQFNISKIQERSITVISGDAWVISIEMVSPCMT